MVSKIQSSNLAALSTELENAKRCVNEMDRLSQGAFSAIACIAKLALAHLETPDGYRHLENIAIALEAIESRAYDAQNCINCTAENVDSHFIDEAGRRRASARRVAADDLKAGVPYES